MKRPFLNTCVLLVMMLGSMFGQQDAALRVDLRFDRPTYSLKGEAVIEVLLTNASRHPIYVYSDLAWGESASLSIWFKDAATGKDVSETFIPDSIMPPPTSKDDFVKILPEHVYGVFIRSSVTHLNIQRKGTYEVVAYYHSPVPRSYAFGLPIWSREDGAIESNRATIKVED